MLYVPTRNHALARTAASWRTWWSTADVQSMTHTAAVFVIWLTVVVLFVLGAGPAAVLLMASAVAGAGAAAAGRRLSRESCYAGRACHQRLHQLYRRAATIDAAARRHNLTQTCGPARDLLDMAWIRFDVLSGDYAAVRAQTVLLHNTAPLVPDACQLKAEAMETLGDIEDKLETLTGELDQVAEELDRRQEQLPTQRIPSQVELRLAAAMARAHEQLDHPR